MEPEPEPVVVAVPAARMEAPEINFRNPLAVRIGLFLAMLTFLLAAILGSFIILWTIVAGGLAAWLYWRRTGLPLSPAGGARLGWITGVFTFVISMVLIAITALAVTDSNFVDLFVEQMKQRGAESTARQLVAALQSPAQIAGVLFEMFIFFALLPVVGGLLGAKLFGGGGRHTAN